MPKSKIKNLSDFDFRINARVVGVVILAILSIGLVYYFTNSPESDSSNVIQIDGKPVETVILKDISGGTNDGKAVRYTKDNMFLHEIVASLPPLKEGSHYEGWLMESPDLYVSTGKLTLLNDPVYTLSFATDKDYEDYLRVVVTLQPDSLKEPDLYILEGYFED